MATAAGGPVGFVLGYRRPDDPEVWFVWQVAVAESHRGQGLGAALLEHVLARPGLAARFLEATVTPSNEASWALFRGLAGRRGAPWSERSGFPAQLFPDGKHEDEIAIRIGPLGPSD